MLTTAQVRSSVLATMAELAAEGEGPCVTDVGVKVDEVADTVDLLALADELGIQFKVIHRVPAADGVRPAAVGTRPSTRRDTQNAPSSRATCAVS